MRKLTTAVFAAMLSIAFAVSPQEVLTSSTTSTTSTTCTTNSQCTSNICLPTGTCGATTVSGPTPIYVAVTGATFGAWSNDAFTWTASTLPTGPTAWMAAAANTTGSLFVAVGTGPTTVAASSTDGKTWTSRTIPTGVWQSVIYAAGQFVATCSNSGATCNFVAISTDGITWSTVNVSGLPSGNFNSIAFGAGLFVTFNTGNNHVFSSPDALTWTDRGAQGGGFVVYGNGVNASGFCLLDGLGNSYTSANGTSWASHSGGITFGNGAGPITYSSRLQKYVALNQGATTTVNTSGDCINWTSSAVLPVSTAYNSIVESGSQLVTVADTTTVVTSVDANAWVLRSMPSSRTWNGLAVVPIAQATGGTSVSGPVVSAGTITGKDIIATNSIQGAIGLNGAKTSAASVTALTAATFASTTNCVSAASPAVCGSAAAGAVVVAAGATTVTVNTTAVTANSQIFILNDDSLGTRLGVTCNTSPQTMFVSARSAGTSFQITLSVAPTTNPECISYLVVN